MDEQLAARQIAEFILGGLDGDELGAVYRHFDECGECVGCLAGVVTSESGAPGSGPIRSSALLCVKTVGTGAHPQPQTRRSSNPGRESLLATQQASPHVTPPRFV